MKRIPLAALLLLGAFALARADEGAYKNLVGMARSAATDRGPDPDADDAPPNASPRMEALRDAVAAVPVPGARSSPAARAPAPRISADAEAASLPAGAAAAFSSPEAKPRLWTRLYSTLLPSWRRPPSPRSAFEPALSTGPVRASAPLPSLMPPPDSEAVAAGERRGLAELMSVAAPVSGQ